MTEEATKPEDSDRDTASKPRSIDSDDVAYPLSSHLQGVLIIQFERGAVVMTPTSQADARSVVAKQRGEESSDALTWRSRRWFSWAEERVVFSSFDIDADQNWEITPEERYALTDAGHAHGVVDSLARLWKRQNRADEPKYSTRAVATLHQMAVTGSKRSTWETAARLLEGDSGALLLAEIWGAAEAHSNREDRTRPRVPEDLIVDHVESDDATHADVDQGPEPASPSESPEHPEDDAPDADTGHDGPAPPGASS
ncbi:hypothetical protein [Nocardioides taihuensis]|uniref:Uncharacterized protein n=1 Tax=Nocardioides taihuensis TaxID=1835606 RepID=A0ABW0BEG8_9ACTN